jgi:copper resistance protein C
VKRIGATFVAAIIALLTTGSLLVSPASAHSDLVSSDPADGAVLDTRPLRLTFVFSEDLLPDFVRFVATDGSVDSGDVPVDSVQGSIATVRWPEQVPGGEWTVTYRAVSQDGHPIEGSITFSYPADATSPAPANSAPTAAPSDPPAVTTTAESTTPRSPWLIVLGVAAVAALIAIAIAVVRRRS